MCTSLWTLWHDAWKPEYDRLLGGASLSTFPWQRGIDRCSTTVWVNTLPWQRIRRLQQTNRSSVCSVCGPHRVLKRHVIYSQSRFPCGGGVEYLHRSPVNRRRQWKGKSRIRQQIWSRVPRDSDARMTALTRTTSNCKRQTRPLVRESVPLQQTRNCLT
jgi:hypothetical protein